MINLFGPCNISVNDFYAWPEHMRHEFAQLANERSIEGMLDSRIIRSLTGIPIDKLAKAITDGCRPFALTYSDARVPDTDEIEHPHVRRKGQAHG